jgi:hypothetical protein
MNKLSIGRVVHIVMEDGQHRPAICVRVWGNEGGNFQAFIDGTNDRDFANEEEQVSGVKWMTSVCYSETPSTRTWHWPERD